MGQWSRVSKDVSESLVLRVPVVLGRLQGVRVHGDGEMEAAGYNGYPFTTVHREIASNYHLLLVLVLAHGSCSSLCSMCSS